MQWCCSLFLFIILTIKASLLMAQQEKVGDYGALYQGPLESWFNAKFYDTHPYWEEDLQRGDVCFDGVLYHDVQLRYDVYHNQLVVITPNRKISVIPDQDKINYFVVEGVRYLRIGQRFCSIEADGHSVALAHSRIKRDSFDKEAGHRLFRMLRTVDHYYLLMADSTMITLKSLRSLKKHYPTYRHQFKSLRSFPTVVVRLDSLLSRNLTDTARLVADLHAHGLMPAVPILRQSLRHEAPDSIFSTQYDYAMPSFHAYSSGHRSFEAWSNIDVPAEGEFAFSLKPLRETRFLQEVVVEDVRPKLQSLQLGMEAFRLPKLHNLPLALGELDVLHVMQTLPGVSTMGEAASGINVRGGASDQTLILFNGNTLYNPMHGFGLFSALNGDMIGETQLYKGGIPSRYGGRTSAIMDLQTRVADWQKWHASASLGLLTSKAALEAPILPGRVTFLLAGRSTYSDWMLKKLPKKSGYRGGTARFWDTNATLSAIINAKHTLRASAYYSHDRFSLPDVRRQDATAETDGYSNLNASVEWHGHYTDRLSTVVSAGLDHYDFYKRDTQVRYTASQFSYSINQYFLRGTTDYILTPQHRLQVGLHSQFYDVMPGRLEPYENFSGIIRSTLTRDHAIESAFFAEDTWTPLSGLTIVGGLRYTIFGALRTGKQRIWQNPEIRLSASWKMAANQSLQFGLNTTHQYIHKVSNTTIMSPVDTWTLSNAYIRPQSGCQITAGYVWQSPSMMYEFTAEAYNKWLSDYLTYRGSARLTMNDNLENDALAVRGRAYGIELQLRKMRGRFSGWLNYTYARTQLQQDDVEASTAINGGRWFSADQDRPHSVKAVANYKFTSRYVLSLNGEYSSGRPVSVPSGAYYNSSSGMWVPFYSERNGYRMPDYLRLDLAFSIEPSHHLTRLFRHWLSFGIYNVLSRRNAYSIYYETTDWKVQGYQLSIFGTPIPFLSYNVKF